MNELAITEKERSGKHLRIKLILPLSLVTEEVNVVEQLEEMVFGASKEDYSIPSDRINTLTEQFKDCPPEPAMRIQDGMFNILHFIPGDGFEAVTCAC
jgi:hypothetical protein